MTDKTLKEFEEKFGIVGWGMHSDPTSKTLGEAGMFFAAKLAEATEEARAAAFERAADVVQSYQDRHWTRMGVNTVCSDLKVALRMAANEDL